MPAYQLELQWNVSIVFRSHVSVSRAYEWAILRRWKTFTIERWIWMTECDLCWLHQPHIVKPVLAICILFLCVLFALIWLKDDEKPQTNNSTKATRRKFPMCMRFFALLFYSENLLIRCKCDISNWTHVFQANSNQFLTTLTQKRFTCVARNSIELLNSIVNCAPDFNPMRYLEIGNFRSQKQLQLTFLFVHSFGLEIKRATNTQTHTQTDIESPLLLYY